MSSLEELWTVLRRAGLEETAPLLIRHGTTSVNQVLLNTDTLLAAGLPQWQLEVILAAGAETTAGSSEQPEEMSRDDLPVRRFGKRANLQAALEAAQPNQRQRSLRLLDQDVLAKSTNPAYEARIRTYFAITRAWEVPAFPLDATNIRCFSASMKAGGYRSAAVFRRSAAISRGACVLQLKDSFDAFQLGRIPPSEDSEPFSFTQMGHIRDMAVLGTWYMLREAELSGARAQDLTSEGNQDSALVRVPQIPQQVLHPDQSHCHRVQLSMAPQTPAAAPVEGQETTAKRSARPKAFASAVRSIQAEMEQIKQALARPEETFVFRPRAKILHRASKYEANDEPSKWCTPCGWNYGCRTFLRTASEEDGARKCRKCFDLSEDSSSESDDSSSGISDLGVSTASSADEME
eukprot:s2457_g4.t1